MHSVAQGNEELDRVIARLKGKVCNENIASSSIDGHQKLVDKRGTTKVSQVPNTFPGLTGLLNKSSASEPHLYEEEKKEFDKIEWRGIRRLRG